MRTKVRLRLQKHPQSAFWIVNRLLLYAT